MYELPSLPIVPGVTFRPIAGLEGYVVGDDGSVWSRHTRSRFRPKGWYRVSVYRRPYGGRYCVVCLRENAGKGKVVCLYVHRLVLEAFVGPCPPGLEACHNDGNSANNRLDNLRWDTRAANTRDQDDHGTRLKGERHPMAKLTDDAVRCIRQRRAAGESFVAIAESYGMHKGTVRDIAQRRRWKHVV